MKTNARKQFEVVALRKESVDRNNRSATGYFTNPRSLSARRAWIEIQKTCKFAIEHLVALRKESVDRNSHLHDVALEIIGRSPQGERG